MVFVKVRETYDLHTVKNKMTVIGIHTPKPDIVKRNYPGLLMQCRAYRPVKADVKVACASVLPLDPLGVGLTDGAVAPEDVFNPILYKALSNKGMSQLEARINMMRDAMFGVDVAGETADVDVDSVTGFANEFDIYYGLLSNTREWKHANPQAGLEMKSLKPLVYEMVYNVGDGQTGVSESILLQFDGPSADGDVMHMPVERILGKAKEFPFLPCTSYSYDSGTKEGEKKEGEKAVSGVAQAGFLGSGFYNSEQNVPFLNVYCGCIIIPPSKLHELFYRMVVEWTIEFTKIRPLGEILNWTDLGVLGSNTHYQNYSYSKVKEAVTGDDKTILEDDSCMVSANVDVKKVM